MGPLNQGVLTTKWNPKATIWKDSVVYWCFIYLLTNLILCYLFTDNIFFFFILSNFNFYYNYFGLFYYCIFSHYQHIHQMQSNTSKITSFFTKNNGCNRTSKKEKTAVFKLRLRCRCLYCLIIFGGIILGVQSVLKN